MKRVAVLGAGGMGTALAMQFGKAGPDVRLWARDADSARRLAECRVNERHLTGIPIGPSIRVTSSAFEATDGAELLVAAIPTSYLRSCLGRLAPEFPPGIPVLSVIKGIENETFARPSQI